MDSFEKALIYVNKFGSICEVRRIKELVNAAVTGGSLPVPEPLKVADINPFIRSEIAKYVGNGNISDDQLIYLYWISMENTSDDQRRIIVANLASLGSDIRFKPDASFSDSGKKRNLQKVFSQLSKPERHALVAEVAKLRSQAPYASVQSQAQPVK